MKVTINLTMVAFWLGLFALIAFSIKYQSKRPYIPSAEEFCIKNNGIPLRDWAGIVKDCKLIKK